MKSFTAVLEKCRRTGLIVAHVPGVPGAHTQGKTLDEVRANLEEVLSMLLEEGEPDSDVEYIGTQTVAV
jgi:predicted RNase H-like HicB family nuclease